MANHCAVCDHPERSAIDAALVGASVPFRAIGSQYGMSHMSCIRHAANHIPLLLAKAHEAEMAAAADTLLEKVAVLEAKANYWHDEARQLNDDAKALPAEEQFPGRVLAIKEGARCTVTIGKVLDLMGRVSGEIRAGVTVNVALLTVEQVREAPAVRVLLEAVASALRDEPVAAAKVARALGQGSAR